MVIGKKNGSLIGELKMDINFSEKFQTALLNA